MAKKRNKKQKSLSAKKGWETRRAKNPLRWGEAAIFRRREEKKELDRESKQLDQLTKEFIEQAPKQKTTIAALESQIEALQEQKRNIERFGHSEAEAWEVKTWEKFQDFIFTRDAGEGAIHKKHAKFYEMKEWIRNTFGREFFAQWMEMIGTAWGLPRYGKFSIESFITS